MMMSEYLTNPSGLASSVAWSYTTVTEHGYRPGGRSGKALVPLWRPPEPLSETIFLVSVRGIRVPWHLMGSLPILIFFFPSPGATSPDGLATHTYFHKSQHYAQSNYRGRRELASGVC